MDTALHTAPGAGTSRAALAYEEIKSGLLSGAHPLGRRLAEERLARELGVSRTPVREALSRLHAERLVERHPDGGYTPAVPDLGEIVDLYEVRAALEQTGLTRRPDGHDVDALRSLQADWQQLAADPPAPNPDFVLVDEDFHIRLAASSGNRSLVDLLSGINESIRIVRMHDFLTEARVEATIEQHLGIVSAVLDGDLAEARTVLHDHLTESEAVVQRRAGDALARMIGRHRSSTR